MSMKESEGRVTRRDFLKKGAAVGVGATAMGGLIPEESRPPAEVPVDWDYTADLVICGAGVAGLAAAVSAAENGASVLAIDENFDIGGHGMISGGNVHLGGGNSRQRKFGIEDSADLVFEDWIRWDNRSSRYSDRDLIRAFADENASTYEWLLENGVVFQDHILGPSQASTVPRQGRTVAWPVASERIEQDPYAVGSGLVRALEKSARDKGVQFLLRTRFTTIIRETPMAGRVVGVTAVDDQGNGLNIRALKGVQLSTGGHTFNVNLRRLVDPRLTEEYQVTASAYSRQSGASELAALAIGANFWATANQTTEDPRIIAKTRSIGCRWGYGELQHGPGPIWHLTKASGLDANDWQQLIMVDMMGRRFYNEMASGFEFYAAAMAYHGDPTKLNGGGPIWAICDQDAIERQEWDPNPPFVDPDGYFAKGDTLSELAANIVNPYQTVPMPGANLEETVSRYNSFVDSGVDEDFSKPTPRYKIQRPPFYAFWSTPILHDSVTGLRTNPRAQVVDLYGRVIEGLYAAGETQGGFAQHGLARCLVFGRIAGRDAALNGGNL